MPDLPDPNAAFDTSQQALVNSVLQASGSAPPAAPQAAPAADPAASGAGAQQPLGVTAVGAVPSQTYENRVAAAQATAPKYEAPGSGGPPDPAKVFASGPQYATETTTSSTSSGMSDKDAAAQRGLIGEARSAQEKANASEGEQRRLQVQAEQQEQERLLHEAAQQQRELAAKQAVVDLQEAEVKNKLQAASDWRPDRSELFSGSTGAARGILAAVAVMAGGWMQGRGMTRDNPFTGAIERMIDDNVNDQVRKNSATIQFLKDQKGDVQAAAAELKKRQLEYAMQKVNARAALSKIPAAQAGVQAFNDAAAARTAEWQAEQEKALRRTVSNTISKHTAPVEAKPGAERSADQAKAQSAYNLLQKFGDKAGLVRNPKTGAWESNGKGAISPTAAEDLNPFDSNEIQAYRDALQEAFGRLQSGGVIGDDEAVRFKQLIGGGAWRRDTTAARLNAIEEMLKPRLTRTDEAAAERSAALPSTFKPLGKRLK